MALPANAIIAFTYRGTLLNQTTLNTVHYRVSNPSNIPTVKEEMEEFIKRFTAVGPNDILTAYKQATPDNLFIRQAVLQPVYPTRYRRVVANLTQQGATDPTEVSNIQAAITFATAKAGRNQIGGIRLPQTPTNAQGGSWIPAWTNTLDIVGDVFSTLLVAGLGGGSYQPVIFHRSPNANPRWDDITDYLIQPTTRVIRRRTVGVGI